MTRINSSIPVKNLTDEHLLAEHREIKRIVSYFEKSLKSGSINKIPKQFCLGTGHVTFFINKQLFCFQRYNEIYNECLERKFQVTDYRDCWLDNIAKFKQYNCWNDYKTTDNENELLIERISKRILESNKPYFHYNSKSITKSDALKILIQ